jgi:HEPN domain-containing protein
VALASGERDPNAAQVLLQPEPSRSVFHSQQAAEKAIKAFLTYRQIPFRKTHDLTDLGWQCASVDPTLEPILREAASLSGYASAFRYPDSAYEPDAAEASGALAIASKLCDEIKWRIEGVQ